MSRYHDVLPLGVPILSVDEQFFFLPPGGHRVHNRARKLLFFFEADCRHRVHELGNESTLRLQAGDILILPHVCRQEYSALGEQTTRIHALRLVLDPEIVPPLILGGAGKPAAFRDESVTALAATLCNRTLHLKNGMTAEVRETLARVRREAEPGSEGRDFGYRYRVGAACVDLMVLVARQLENNTAQSTPRLTQGGFHVEEVREFVSKHLDTSLRLESIAAHLSISPEHLARVWKKATGSTVFEYVRRARIERAKSLLISSDANISQIALACGFSSLALFSRTFKQDTGVSPKLYRERLVSAD